MTGFSLVLLGVWAFACWFLYSHQDALIFPNGGPHYDACDEFKALGGVAESRIYDGQMVRYVLFKGTKAKATLLFFHGNGGTVCYRALHAEHLRSPDWDLVMLEYPGYGGDPAPPCQARILDNALAAYDLLKNDHPERPIMLFGKSLGSGPATYLASKRPVAAFVDQTPYPSINAIADARFKVIPVGLLNRSPFPAEDWAPNVSCPVLVLHGTSDEVIPFELGKEQAGRFPHLEDFEVFKDAHHTDMPYRESGRYWSIILGFLRQHLRAAA
jgi:pimeloyl-ACP methyl ester carboxylesterase